MANNTNLFDEYGRVVRPILLNTAKDGSGTWYFALVDSDGHLQVDSLSALPAGGNLIGKVSEPATVETPFTATGDIVAAAHKIAPAAVFKLTEIELHLASAPTGANPNLVITLDDGVGAAYDLVILTLDLVANGVTDLVIKPNKVCKATDVITAAWTNTNNITWAIKFKHQLL